MADKVGEIYYEVTLETGQALKQQAELEKQLGEMPSSLTEAAKAAQTYAAATEVAAKAAKEAASATQQQAAAAQAAETTAKSAARTTDATTQATQRATKATQDNTKATDGAAKSAGELKQAARQLPAQFTDIVTSIQAGQDPLTVLIQQGGQLKDQFGGVGAAARAMGGYIIGLLTPVTAVVAAIATMTAGFVMGRKESENLSKSLILTGQQTGVTADQLSAMAAKMDGMAGVTQAKATEALIAFVEAGVRGGESLQKFTEAAIQLEKVGGASVTETAAKFRELEREPYKAAIKLDEAINFLDASTRAHIKSLEEQGRMTDAARVAQNAYADAIAGRVPQITDNLGYIERAWRGIVGAAKEAGDALLSIGRNNNKAQELLRLEKELADMAAAPIGINNAMGRKKQARIDEIKAEIAAEADLAAQQAKVADQKRARDKADADAAKYLTDQEKMRLQIAKELGTLREAGASDAEMKAREKAIKEDFAKKQPKPPKGRELSVGHYMAGLSAKAAEDEWQRITILEEEALRQNDEWLSKKKLSQKEYEDSKTLIIQGADIARQKLMAKDTETYLGEMTRRYAEEQRIAQAKEEGIKAAKAAIAGDDPLEQIRLEEETKLALLEEYRQRDLANEQVYQDAKNAIKKKADMDAWELQMRINIQSAQLMQSGADMALEILTKAGKERTALGKAFFLASKALAVAEIIMNTEIAASKVMQQTGLFGIPMATLVRAQGYASAGMVAGMAVADAVGGRAYGGPVSADSLYRVNEKGAPEMFTAANGSQYMMPTTNGRVTAADKVGGGAPTVNIVVNNTAPGTVASATYDDQSRTVSIAVTEVANQIRTNTGPVWSAMRGATNVQARM